MGELCKNSGSPFITIGNFRWFTTSYWKPWLNQSYIQSSWKLNWDWGCQQFFSRYFMCLKGFMENKSLALLSRDWICTRDRKGNYWLRNWKMAFKFSIFFPFKERKLGIFNYNPNASCLAVPKPSSLLESPILIINTHTHTHTHTALHELWPPVENLESLSSPHHPPIISRILGSTCLISPLHQVQYYCHILYPLWPKCKFVLLFASLQWHLSYTCWKLYWSLGNRREAIAQMAHQTD